MRSYVEEVLGEEEAVTEIDLPITSQAISQTKTYHYLPLMSSPRAEAMYSLIKQRERRLSNGIESNSAPLTPSRPEASSNSNGNTPASPKLQGKRR